MPWFYCDICCDTIKKPKVAAHLRVCSNATFTCIDCSRNFDSKTVQSHNSCVTEVQKYAEGATKPGGPAAAGFFDDQRANTAAGEAVGSEYLSKRPPWKCSICKVSCTSEATLLAHASGTKHQRRFRAAAAAAAGGAATTGAAAPEDGSNAALGGAGGAGGAGAAKTAGAAAATEAAAPKLEANAEAERPPDGRAGSDSMEHVLEETTTNSQEGFGKKPKKRQRNDSDAAGNDRKAELKASKAGRCSSSEKDISGVICHILRKRGTIPLSKLAKVVQKKVDVSVTSERIVQEIIKLDGANVMVSVSPA